MRAPTIINEAVFYDALIEIDGEEHFLPFGRTVQASIIVDRLNCAVLLPRRSLPDDAVAGELVKATLRDQAGNALVRLVQLRGLNQFNGAIACDDANKAGMNVSDRVVRVASEHGER